MEYAVGEGHRIRFWYDPWSGPIPLKDLYPDLFTCAVSKEAWIFDSVVSNLEGGNRSWNLHFCRAFHEREVERACSLLKHLYSNMPRGEGDDVFTQKLNHFGVFDVRSYYNLLANPDALLLSLFSGTFGVQRYLKGCFSFYGQQLGIVFLPLITWFLGVYHWLISVAFAGVMRKLWIIFYSIVSLLMPCEAFLIFGI